MAEDKQPTEEIYKERLEQVKANADNLKEVNLNNLENSKPEWINDLIDALVNNTHVETVQLVNCMINNEGGKKIGELLKSNKVIKPKANPVKVRLDHHKFKHRDQQNWNRRY